MAYEEEIMFRATLKMIKTKNGKEIFRRWKKKKFSLLQT